MLVEMRLLTGAVCAEALVLNVSFAGEWAEIAAEGCLKAVCIRVALSAAVSLIPVALSAVVSLPGASCSGC